MKLSLERYAQTGFGIAALTIVLAASAEYSAVQTLIQSTTWVSHTIQVMEEIANTRGMVKASESAARGFALTADPAFLDALRTSVASANQHERELRSLTADNPRQQQYLDKLEPLMSQRFRVLDELTAKRRSAGAEAAAQFASTPTGTTLASAIEALSLAIQNEEGSLLVERRAALEKFISRALMVSALAAVFSLLLLGAASAIIHLDMRRRHKLATDLSHERDLFTTLMNNVPACVSFKDADGRFLRINAAMARRLHLVSPSDAKGRTDADFYAPGHVTAAREDELEVLRTGRPIHDKEEPETFLDGSTAWVMSSRVPMVDREGATVGTIGVTRDITSAKKTASELAGANSQLASWNAQLELRNSEIMLLGEMGELLQTCVSEAEAERILSQFGRRLCPGLSGALGMTKASRNLVERTGSWGDMENLASAYSPEDCWALRRGRAHGSGVSEERIRCAHIKASFAGSFVCVPMMAHGETLGVLHFLRDSGPDLDKSELRLANMIAERMALAIANLRLREALKAQSIRDPLTGLFNRRYMEESLEREIHRAEGNRSSVGAMMLDLDHFKRFNDNFGHAGGDVVLKEFSRVLQDHTRKEDIVCRYGGEEFLIILPGRSLEDTRRKADALLAAVREMGVHLRGQELGPVSVSIGVAAYPGDAATSASLIRIADGALYEAKMSGRDRVIVAGTRGVGVWSGGSRSARNAI